MKRNIVLPCLTLTLAVALAGCSKTANAGPTPSAPAVAPTESAEASPDASPSASPNSLARGFDRAMDDLGSAAGDVARGVGDAVGDVARGTEGVMDGAGRQVTPGWEPKTTTR